MKKRFATFCLLSLAFFFALGCASTVTPRHVVDDTPAFDGTEQNGGFIRYHEDGSGIITDGARVRYNLLVDQFGSHFDPKIERDAGITPFAFLDGRPTWKIDPEHLVKFATMNRWRKEGKAP